MGIFSWFKKPKETPKPTPVKLDVPVPKPVKLEKPKEEVPPPPEPIENVLAISATGPKLPIEAQTAICQLLGQFKKASEVIQYIEQRFDLKIQSQAVYYYAHHGEWASLVARYRQEYLADIDSIPIKHKRVRFTRLETLYEQAQGEPGSTTGSRRDKRRELLDILRQAKAEEVEALGQQTNIVAINLQGLSDADLLKKVEELRAKVTKLGGKLDAARTGIPDQGQLIPQATDAQIVEGA